MARHVPTTFAQKVRDVQDAVDQQRAQPRRQLTTTAEVTPGVRLVVTQREGEAIVFSRWTEARDIAEICGDAAYPAALGLLALDKEQVRSLSAAGITVDLSRFVRSETVPGLYYVLLDHVSDHQVRTAVDRLLPEPLEED